MVANKSSLRSLYKHLKETEAGYLFERLVRRILQDLHPVWSAVLKQIVPWTEHARRFKLPAKDVGVDLVGYGRDGKAYAIQTKLWGKPLSWNDLGTFVGAVSNPTHRVHHGLLVAPEGVTQEAEWVSKCTSASRSDWFPSPGAKSRGIPPVSAQTRFMTHCLRSGRWSRL